MSITVRLWTKNELKNISEGENDNLATVLMNCKSYTEDMLAAVHSLKIRNFVVWFTGQDFPVLVNAKNEETLAWFLKQEYNTGMIESIFEKVTEIREVEIEF